MGVCMFLWACLTNQWIFSEFMTSSNHPKEHQDHASSGGFCWTTLGLWEFCPLCFFFMDVRLEFWYVLFNSKMMKMVPYRKLLYDDSKRFFLKKGANTKHNRNIKQWLLGCPKKLINGLDQWVSRPQWIPHSYSRWKFPHWSKGIDPSTSCELDIQVPGKSWPFFDGDGYWDVLLVPW